MQLRYAKRIDFTGDIADFDNFEQFGEPVIELLRAEGRSKLAIIVDRGFGFDPSHEQAHVVIDSLNLSCDNPLVGPNNPIGERFPVVNNIYVSAADTMDQEETWSIGNPLGKLRNGVAAGVKQGHIVSSEDLVTCNRLGANFYCYNLVPAMIIAAHAGLRVLGLVVPEGQTLQRDVLMAIHR
ncbi:MAG: hypothetical protein KGS72_04145 [Cyanobacteria bacterium REEB67]|nr:hypothetical protein [Cyanobacteria bacterium REEB67]